MRAVTVLICAALGAALAVGCASAALTQDQIVPAFIAASQADTRTMHMEWHGSMSNSQLPADDPAVGPVPTSETLNGVFDFNGPDYAGALESGMGGPSQGQTSYARVGGVAFINFNNGGWQRASDFGQPPTEMDPLTGLAASDVAYEAVDNLNGRQVHRLRVLDPVAALARGLFGSGMFGAGSLTLAPDGRADYLIYVDTNGIPVGAQLALDLTASGTEIGPRPADATYQVQFDYEFSLWGEPLTIDAPDLSTNGGGIGFPPQPRVQPSF